MENARSIENLKELLRRFANERDWDKLLPAA
jgi:hypothetical protein